MGERFGNKPEYKNHKVIFITHSYLDIGNKRVTKDGYKISPQNSGQAIWEKLIYPSSNIRLVLCGHVGRGTGEYENNVAYRVDDQSTYLFSLVWDFKIDQASGTSYGTLRSV